MANEKVDSQVIDALTIGNTKTIAEAAAFAMASMFQHQVNHARRLDALAEAHLGKVLDKFASVDPVEAVSTAKLFKGESDSSMSSLLAQLASGQIGAKVAQSTPGDLAGDLAKIGASVSSLQATVAGLVALTQQIMKGAQTTPPQA
jgi:hypothetical protein